MSAVFNRRKTHRCCTACMEDEALIGLPDQDQRRGPLDQRNDPHVYHARKDVMALDDLGIQQAMARLYKLDMSDKKRSGRK